MLRVLLLFCVAAFVCGESVDLEQNGTFTFPNFTNSSFPNSSFPPINPAVFMQVQQEEFMAKTYLDIVLKMQHATFSSMASMMYSQMMMLEYQEDSQMGSFEEEDEDYTLFTEGGFAGSMDDKQMQLELISSYYLYTATKYKFYQAIYKAGDVQKGFWMDRAIQIFLQAAAPQLPPQIVQLGYMKIYRTNLETLKLAMNFQYLSHFVTWLEDAMDVAGSVTDPTNPYGEVVAMDQSDDLIRDKMFAFNAYNSYAILDFQTFLLDSYFEAMFGMAQSPNRTSFLEEEVEVKEGAEPTESQFYPAMMSNPMFLMKVYKFYFLMFQMHAAQCGLTSVYAERLAYEGNEGSDQFKTFAQQMFGGFAMNMYYMSQLERIAAIFQMWMMYLPLFAQGGSI